MSEYFKDTTMKRIRRSYIKNTTGWQVKQSGQSGYVLSTGINDYTMIDFDVYSDYTDNFDETSRGTYVTTAIVNEALKVSSTVFDNYVVFNYPNDNEHNYFTFNIFTGSNSRGSYYSFYQSFFSIYLSTGHIIRIYYSHYSLRWDTYLHYWQDESYNSTNGALIYAIYSPDDLTWTFSRPDTSVDYQTTLDNWVTWYVSLDNGNLIVNLVELNSSQEIVGTVLDFYSGTFLDGTTITKVEFNMNNNWWENTSYDLLDNFEHANSSSIFKRI